MSREDHTDSFVQEVDESMRQDTVLRAARKYGPFVIGIFVVFLLALGGWQWWRDAQLKSSRAHSDQFVAAQELLRNGDVDGAKAEFERLSGEGPANYRVMAQMEHAAILVGQGDLENALKEYDAAAAAAHDPILKESAQIRAAYIAADTQDFDAVQARLKPLVESDGQVSYLAKELLGVEAWEAGQTELARSTLENLSLAFEAPESVRNRAQLALAVIGPAPEAAEAPAPAQQRQPSEGETK